MLTKGAIGNLVNRYRAVLTKCNLINTFGSLAVASMLVLGGAGVAMAKDLGEQVSEATGPATITLQESTTEGSGLSTNNLKGTSKDNQLIIDLNGKTYTQTKPSVGSSGTQSQAAQLRQDNYITMKNGTLTANGSAEGSNSKFLINNYSNLTIENVILDGRNLKDTPGVNYVLSNNYGTTTITGGSIIAKDHSFALDVCYSGGAANGNTYDSGLSVTVDGTDITGRIEMTNAKTDKKYADNAKHELTLKNLTMAKNDASKNPSFKNGGAIAIHDGATKAVLTLENVTFANNEATFGGAIWNQGTVNITGGSFSGNKATSAAGAIYNDNKSTLTLTDVTFEKNSAGASGGGAINNAQRPDSPNGNGPAKLTINGGSFTENSAVSMGGAIRTEGEVTIDGTIFTGNTSGNGGAIWSGELGRVGIKNATFTGNTAFSEDTKYTKQGGAIVQGKGGSTTVEDSTFTDNRAYGQGGAIYNAGTLTLMGTNTFSGNMHQVGADNEAANDIYNDGTLIINGEAIFDGGISGTGTVTSEKGGTIVVNDEAASFEGKVEDGAKLTAKGSGDLNDQTGGDIEALNKQLKGLGLEATGMDEGLISGEVIVDGDKVIKKVNTVLEDTLEQATAAPLAVNRILMNDVRKRMGDLRDTKEDSGVWMRWDGGKLKGDEGLTNNFNTIQIGADMLTGIKNVRAGVAGSFTHGDVDHNNGDGEMEAYTFAAYGTWMADNGMFADVIARVGFNNTELNIKGGKADLDNEALSLSAEYGWRFDLGQQFFVEPQAELTYTHVTGADFTIKTASYDVDSMDSLLGRAGLAAGWKLPNERGNVYARASVVHEFLGDAEITGTNKGNSIPYELDGEDTWLEYGIGANVKLTDNTYVWADVERTEGADIEEEWRGTVGIRYSF